MHNAILRNHLNHRMIPNDSILWCLYITKSDSEMKKWKQWSWMNQHFENLLTRFKISIPLTDSHWYNYLDATNESLILHQDIIALSLNFFLLTCLLVFHILRRNSNLIIKCWQTTTTPSFRTLTIFTHVHNLWNVSVPASKICTCFKCRLTLLLRSELISMDVRTLWNRAWLNYPTFRHSNLRLTAVTLHL